MVFHITQLPTPENCPKDVGGAKTLDDPPVEGVQRRGMYGAFSQHVLDDMVEAESLAGLHKSLNPGWTRCTATITPVSEEPMVR